MDFFKEKKCACEIPELNEYSSNPKVCLICKKNVNHGFKKIIARSNVSIFLFKKISKEKEFYKKILENGFKGIRDLSDKQLEDYIYNLTGEKILIKTENEFKDLIRSVE